VKLVRGFAKEFGLTVQAGTPAPGRRTMKLTGTVANLQRAFGAERATNCADKTRTCANFGLFS
jgi:kumamolisin